MTVQRFLMSNRKITKGKVTEEEEQAKDRQEIWDVLPKGKVYHVPTNEINANASLIAIILSLIFTRLFPTTIYLLSTYPTDRTESFNYTYIM